MFQNTRLTFQEILNISNSNMKTGITRISGYGEVIVTVTGYVYSPPTDTGYADLIIYTPGGQISEKVLFKNMSGWTPYTGPMPPQFGHQGGLPGGMGGQGWGQGQAFPGSGQGGWGPWSGF